MIKNWLRKRFGLFPDHGHSGGYVMVSGNLQWVDGVNDFITEGYSANDIVYSIINSTTEKIRVAPWNVYKIKDESSLKQYKAEISKKSFSKKKVQELQYKALELYDGDEKLNELLKWPNEDGTFSDLVADSSAWKMATGNRFLRATLLTDGANKGRIQEIDILPSQYMSVLANRSFPMRKRGYQLDGFGAPIPLSVEEIMHDKYLNMAHDISGAHLYGMSPLKAAARNLTRSKYAKVASASSYENGGPAGVLFVDDDRLTGEQGVEQASAVKGKFIEEYSGYKNIKKIVVSGYKVGWQEMGLSPVDLNILEAEKWDLNMICAVFNFPTQMLAPDSKTYNNVSEAEKALTMRTAIPLMNSFRDNFNRKLYADWGYKGKNIYIDYDLSVYSELADDMAQLTEWVEKSWWLPVEMKYQLQQMDIPEWMDEQTKRQILVPAGFQRIEDVGVDLSADMDMIDNEIDNEQGNL